MKRLTTIIISLLILIFPIMAAQNIPEERQLPLLVDDAGLLSDGEYNSLLSQLEEISSLRECEVIVVTTDFTDGKSARDYADDFYDYNGYGYGPNDDGVLLLVAMDIREWHISTYGFGIEAFTDYGIDTIADSFLPYLSDGDYFSAFSVFASHCDSYLQSAREGSPVDIYIDDNYTDDYEKVGFVELLKENIGIIFIVSLVIALIITGIMRASLKSVRPKQSASDYTVPGSLNLKNSQDIYLYRNVRKTARSQDSGGRSSSSSGRSGGSSTHRSSSGRSHGGRGGSF